MEQPHIKEIEGVARAIYIKERNPRHNQDPSAQSNQTAQFMSLHETAPTSRAHTTALGTHKVPITSDNTSPLPHNAFFFFWFFQSNYIG